MLTPRKPLGGQYVGEGGALLTPEQLAERRAVAEALMSQGADFSPAGSEWEALGRAFNGWWGGKQSGDMRRQEEADTAATRAEYESVFGSGSSGSSDGVSAVAKALAGGGGGGGAGGEWLRYTNQGATRNKPIADPLVEAMSFLPDLGLTMEVYSGGQEAEGPNRVGSTRHDHGNAADVMFRDASGRMLDWNNPNDVPVLQQIVSTARANGVTGFGAGDDYMGAGRMHIGFGNPGVWGAGGKGANAPAWLTEAFNGATPRAATTSVRTTPAGPSSQDIMRMMANPRMMTMYGPQLEAQLRQVQAVEQATLEQQRRQSDPMYQAELEARTLANEAARNPVQDPWAGTEVINNQVVRMGPNGPEVVADYRTINPQQEGRYQPVGGQIWDFQPEGGGAPVLVGGGQEEIVFGPDGQPIMVRGPSGSGKALTEGQGKDVVYSTRAEGALRGLESMDPSVLSSRGDVLLDKLPLGIGRDLQSEGYQEAQNLGNEFLQAILRKDTGAAITADEQELYGDTYLPRPGDNPGVLEVKKQARARAVEALKGGMDARQVAMTESAIVRAAQRSAGEEPAQGKPAKVDSKAAFDALPSGATFIAPDGTVRRKP